MMEKTIPVSILGCPIEFWVSKNVVFFDTDAPRDLRTLLAPGRVFTHPVLGNMTPEFIKMDPKTGHGTRVFCQLLDHKQRRENDVCSGVVW